MLGTIERNFKYMDNFTFITLCKSLVRSHLYAGSIWSSHKKELIELMKKGSKKATKILLNLKYLSYEDRLKILNLPIYTLIYKRYRGDILVTYRILRNIQDKSTLALILNKLNSTTGNNLE